jgi:hypothetical protein
MMPMTPSGTRILPTVMPDGRRLRSVISPTGSGSAATCSRPTAIASMPLADRVRRSIIDGSRPLARASARSRALASRSCAARARISAAIARRALFLASVEAAATLREALRAWRPTVCM